MRGDPPPFDAELTEAIVCTAFAVMLRAHRKRLGLTQTELADKAGLTQRAIGMIEAEQRTPTLRTIAKLSYALAATISVHPDGKLTIE